MKGKRILAMFISVILLGTQNIFAERFMTVDGNYTTDRSEYSGYEEHVGGGAVFYVTDTGNLIVRDNVTFYSNSIVEGLMGDGGAIYNEGGTVTIGSGSVFDKNKSMVGYGGAVSNRNGTMTIDSNAKFKNNTTNSRGGALYNIGTLTFSDGALFENNTAKSNTTKQRGYGGAIMNGSNAYPGAILNLIANTKDIKFTGNVIIDARSGSEQKVSDAICDWKGIINLWASNNANIIFNDKITTDTDYGNGAGTLNINKAIEGYQENVGTGIIELNENMSEYIGTVNLYGGTVKLGAKGKWFGGNTVIENESTIDIGNGLRNTFNLKNITMNNTLNLIVDADLGKNSMDTVEAENVSGVGKIKIKAINIISDSVDSVEDVLFTETESLFNKIESVDMAASDLYTYKVTYNGNGTFNFLRSDNVSPLAAASAIAASVGSYAEQSLIIDQAFASVYNKKISSNNSLKNKKNAKLNSSNLYVSAGSQLFDDTNKIEKGLWLRPFVLQETVKVGDFDIDNNLYGTLAGIDLFADKDNNVMASFYLGYAGSQQKYENVKINQTGYVVGLTGMISKEKYYLAITLNEIFNKVENQIDKGTDNFDMNMFTIGAKAGYNYNINEKWTLEPNITLMYGTANNESYKTRQGASIDGKATNNILVEPQVKAKWQLTNGWQPYGLLGYSANLSRKPTIKANGIELELDNIDGYVEYGVGVNKEFIGSVWSCYGQVTGRSGGRNGFGGNLGIKYKF